MAEGAARRGRDPDEVALTMYIRVCVDDDVEAARRAFGAQVLGYAMGRPGAPLTAGYRGLFAEMGFGDVLSELEERRAGGASMDALVGAAPDDMLNAVGYFGPAAGAAPAYARLTAGLDETMVRIITARPGLEPVVATMEASPPIASELQSRLPPRHNGVGVAQHGRGRRRSTIGHRVGASLEGGRRGIRCPVVRQPQRGPPVRS